MPLRQTTENPFKSSFDINSVPRSFPEIWLLCPNCSERKLTVTSLQAHAGEAHRSGDSWDYTYSWSGVCGSCQAQVEISRAKRSLVVDEYNQANLRDENRQLQKENKELKEKLDNIKKMTA
jgi:hypothetical protein